MARDDYMQNCAPRTHAPEPRPNGWPRYSGNSSAAGIQAQAQTMGGGPPQTPSIGSDLDLSALRLRAPASGSAAAQLHSIAMQAARRRVYPAFTNARNPVCLRIDWRLLLCFQALCGNLKN